MAASPQHATLVSGEVMTFTFDRDFKEVEVINVTGEVALYFTANGDAPSVAGTGSYVVTAGAGAYKSVRPTYAADDTDGDRVTVVKVIADGTPDVSVEGK